ncbi:alpha/beta hydrolase family protein [Leptospira perolatii]|nr:alpha/beta hydrolase [Leptospira perolatii]
MESLAIVAYPYLINTCAITPVVPGGPVPQITSGYGARGTHSVSVNILPNPVAPKNVCVYFPADQSGPAPVLFLFHGFSAPSAEPYYPLIDFYVSKGYVVVFPIYFSDDRDPLENYDIMWNGILSAVQQYPDKIDTTRVGFMGHSYGGGATPYMAKKGLVTETWGSNGGFIFMVAPWYSFGMTDTDLTQIPASTKLLVQIYENDQVTDHRMGIDIFQHITSIANTEKDFLSVYTDSSSGTTLLADHYVPIKDTIIGIGALDALDYYGVWKPLEALADYTFNNNATAKTIALGDGASSQKFMGQYLNGNPVKEMTVSDSPVPLQPESYFSQPFSDPKNPR